MAKRKATSRNLHAKALLTSGRYRLKRVEDKRKQQSKRLCRSKLHTERSRVDLMCYGGLA